jgi:hypothetical protein
LGGGTYTVPTGIIVPPLPDVSSGSVPLPTNVGTTTIENPFRRGYVNSYNLTVEQQFKGVVIDTGYVGTMAVRPLVNMNVNASAPGAGNAGGLLSTALGQTYTGTINALVPFKNNYYNSLQTKATRHFSDGSLVGVAWTWSKAIDYEDNEDLSSLAFPFPAFWSKDKGLAGFDRTHNIEGYSVIQLPFGKNQHWVHSGVGNAILGGWQINPIVISTQTARGRRPTWLLRSS